MVDVRKSLHREVMARLRPAHRRACSVPRSQRPTRSSGWGRSATRVACSRRRPRGGGVRGAVARRARAARRIPFARAVTDPESTPDPATTDRPLPGRPRRRAPRAAAVQRRPRHERDAEVDPGPLRRRGRDADRQPRPAGRGLRAWFGARRCELGAVDCHVVDAREEFAREYVAPAIKANAIYGLGYPLFTALGRPLIAKLAVELRARDRLRHDRPRLHRQGQRPGADRGDDRDARARAEGDRAGALVADGTRGGDRATRASTGSRSRAAPRSRRTRSTTTSGGARARAGGSRSSTTRPRTTSSSWSPGPRRRPTSPSS